MPRAGTVSKQRAKLGLPPLKPGKPGWVHGTKLPFFEKMKESYLAAAELKTTGGFYDRAAQEYLAVYGYNTPFEGDLEEGETVADDIDPDEDLDALSTEVAEERAEFFQILRKKIGVWFNAQYGASARKKSKKKAVTFKQVFDKPEMEPPAPVKSRVLHYYSRHFYHERIKPRVVSRWAAISRLPPTTPPMTMVTVRGIVTKEAWKAESDGFKAEVLQSIENEHKGALEAYRIAIAAEEPTTAEEYDVALNNAAHYLQPFADAAHGHFGMNVVILLCGPIPDRGGRIEVRSIHSGMSKGLVPRIWSDFDRAGFDVAQRSFIDFSHECFTAEECRARGLAETSTEETVSSGHVSGAVRDEIPPAPATIPDLSGPAPIPTSSGGEGVPGWHQTWSSAPYDFDPANFNPAFFPGGQEDDDDLYNSMQLLSETQGDPAMLFGSGLGDIRLDAPALVLRTALRSEIALMAEEERAAYMLALQGMSPTRVEWENEMASNRAMLGMPKDGRDGEARREPEELDGAGSLPPPPPPPAEQIVPASPLVITPPPLPIQVTPPPPPPVRPRPKALYLSRTPELQRPEENPDAQGPLMPDAVRAEVVHSQVAPELQRPEENPDAQGPLMPDTVRAEVVRSEEEQNDDAGVWEQDTSAWSTELRDAFAACARGKSWGGTRWGECVKLWIAVERASGFATKGLVAAPAGNAEVRPKEIPSFMQAARHWEKPVGLFTAIGPVSLPGSFSKRWWIWWERSQPAGRVKKKGPMLDHDRVATAKWEDLGRMVGRNGLLLYLGSLLWWGEAALQSDDAVDLMKDWNLAVDDVARALAKALEAVGPSAVSGKKGPQKRKRVASTDKENTTSKEPRKKRRAT